MPGITTSKLWGAIALTALTTIATTISVATTAQAQSPEFYAPPAETSSTSPGAILKAEPLTLLLEIPTPDGILPAAGTRIMYSSTDGNGQPTAVTGTYLDPAVPWNGPGQRPLVSLAPGTQGQGDQCAPSKLASQLIQYTPPLDLRGEYEIPFITAMLAQGIAVVVTDYQGLGTPGHHTYVNRLAQGHAVLDAARAAQQLPGTRITNNGPVALWGYSQGGSAAASAAELHTTYAPELDLKGTYAGAPPSDLAAVLQGIDGTILTGAIGYAINGITETYPDVTPILETELNERGTTMLRDVAGQCVAETALTYGFQQTSSFTRSGEPLSAVLDRYGLVTGILEDQKLGSLTPSAPVLLQIGTADDIIPAGQVRQLAADWCSRGATVQLTDNPLPPILPGLAVNHALPYVAGIAESITFINDRIADRPVTGNC
ncbi:alpha/beta fold hydrolase [Lolliginicoccus suaedae]|uniref:alpha/beta fold hydrolase n=1 Tax=Lolliginicoccus suaedae TaxID=2605429 RepID=UPI0011EBE503|nr:alpha/beta fold hydrolase [Lolliginicoccus suaedae]